MCSNSLILRDGNPSVGTVLVVDDEAFVRDLLARWLKEHGWNCLLAEDSEQALEVLSQQTVEIVVADIGMPGKPGTWLLEHIRAHWPDISVLMLTASSDTRTAVDALMHGASAYLLKPIRSEEFLFHIRQTWEHRQLVRERRQHLHMLERRVQEQTLTIRRAHEETIYRLVTAAGYRDEETGAHIRRTGLFSEVLARSVGWTAREAEELRMAAPMHDVGKIAIPDSILRKPGKLTPQEFAVMQQHTTIGARMLAGSSSPVLQLAEKIALSHHERWDGQGYPQGLAGEAIPEAARIVSIVDVYDALSHDRVYRPAFRAEQVIEMLQAGYGTQFDPWLLTRFFSVLDEIEEIANAHPDGTSEKPSNLATPALDLAVSPVTAACHT